MDGWKSVDASELFLSSRKDFFVVELQHRVIYYSTLEGKTSIVRCTDGVMWNGWNGFTGIGINSAWLSLVYISFHGPQSGSYLHSLFILHGIRVCMSGAGMYETPEAYFCTPCRSPGTWLRVDHWHIKAGLGGFCSLWAPANGRQSRRTRAKCVLAFQTEQKNTWSQTFPPPKKKKNASSSVLSSPAASGFFKPWFVFCASDGLGIKQSPRGRAVIGC